MGKEVLNMIPNPTFYKNEIIVGLAILGVVDEIKTIDISKAVLISPVVGNKSIVEFLKSKKTQVRSMEELIEKKSGAFINFNEKYLEDLVLSMNSIMLYQELGLLEIQNEKLVRTELQFDFNSDLLGKRAEEVICACKKLARLLEKEEARDLYLGLRIEL